MFNKFNRIPLSFALKEKERRRLDMAPHYPHPRLLNPDVFWALQYNKLLSGGLTEFHIEDQYLNDVETTAIGNAIAQHTSLVELTMRNIKFSDESVKGLRMAFYLSESIRNNTTIERVVISDEVDHRTELLKGVLSSETNVTLVSTRHSAEELMMYNNLPQLLLQNRVLKRLHLSGKITSDSLDLLMIGLHSDLPIEELSLTHSWLNGNGLVGLYRAMTVHPTWSCLSVFRNTGIGLRGLAMFGEELLVFHEEYQNKSLHFDLTECVDKYYNRHPCSDRQHVPPDEAMLRLNAHRSLLRAVKENFFIMELFDTDRFRSVTSAQCGLWPEDMIEIMFHLFLNKSGRYLVPLANVLPRTILCHVVSRLRYGKDDYLREVHPYEFDEINGQMVRGSFVQPSKLQYFEKSAIFFFLRELSCTICPWYVPSA